MMYRRRAVIGMLLLCALVWGTVLPCKYAGAEGRQQDILVLYSDGASDSDRDNLVLLAENLTYQGYEVTFASASAGMDKLQNYKNIVLYKLERYPEEFIGKLYKRERDGEKIAGLSERGLLQDKTEEIRILFMGNTFFRDYLDKTGRKDQYHGFDIEVANLQYAFSSISVKETLAAEDGFLFLKDVGDTFSGNVRLAGTEGYFSAGVGILWHITMTDLKNPLVRAAAFREISQWMWREDSLQTTYAQYLVIDRVYPFQNPERLLYVIQKFTEQELPFIITVMPVYEHGDYPAMQRFCETLRYAQANGGMIMIHSPLNQMAYFDAKEVNDALALAMDTYTNLGVYPMGLQIPESWLFRQDTLEVMKGFKTIMVAQEKDRLAYSDIDLDTNLGYREEFQWIAPAIALDEEGVSYLTCYSSALYFSLTEEDQAIDRRLKAFLESEAPLKNLWEADHFVSTGTTELFCRNRNLYVDGELTELSFVSAQEPEDFAYNRNMLQRVSRDLTEQNRRLLAAVVLVSLLFIGFIILARYRNRKRFFIRIPFRKEEALKEGPETRKIEQDEADDYDIKELDENDDYDI